MRIARGQSVEAEYGENYWFLVVADAASKTEEIPLCVSRGETACERLTGVNLISATGSFVLGDWGAA